MSIENVTKLIYKKFNEIRDKCKENIAFPLWDVVVLTASDDEQKLAYELQLEHKIKCKEIPSGIDYHVFSDPPGAKIGCGGATMHVISKLTDIYGSSLEKLFILLINAGGQSQRLPSASVLGKIFTALPFGDPVWQLLELKLACYIPFLTQMKPGYFHAASDTIEVYDVGGKDDEEKWNFTRPGLTALAHPSSLKIGTTHGVFILEDREESLRNFAEFQTCLEVLQKPTVDEMRSKNAIIKQIRIHKGLQELEEIVYTDSCFYFDHKFAKKLLTFYEKEKPLQCEIDGYGDFMQSLGPNATSDFSRDFRNVSKIDPLLESTRLKLFYHLHGTPLNVITLDASKFYHIGTLKEYLENLNSFGDLANYVGWKNNTFSKVTNHEQLSNESSIIHTLLGSDFEIGSSSIVEFCQFVCSVKIEDNCIVSNCCCDSQENNFILTIPSNLFLHTIPVKYNSGKENNETWYVSLVFGVNDDIKKRHTGIKSLKFLGKSLSEVIGNVSEEELFGSDVQSNDTIISLWYARLFPVMKCMESSLLASLALANGNGFQRYAVKWMSAFDAIQNKDIRSMLAYRDMLKQAIVKN